MTGRWQARGRGAVRALLAATGTLDLARRLRRRPAPAVSGEGEYERRKRQEQATYEDVADVHELPEIFHYWSNRYLLPKCQALGFSHPDEFFAIHLERSMRPDGPSRFASIGAGNCDTEVRVAKRLLAGGRRDFTIECLELNPDMLGRGLAMARAEGVEAHIRAVRADFNEWSPAHGYEAVMANQSLHHVVALEHLFDAVRRAIGARGRFVISDMIGRNGHQRWPEALAIVREFWAELPPAYRYNRQLRRQEDTFLDWDCAVSGFEGIRAQDILPLLAGRFRFELFLPFANVIDPFIDRGFGHHFDAASERDRAFIDRVHARDEAEMAAGRITPCHLMAVACDFEPAEVRLAGSRGPLECIRVP